MSLHSITRTMSMGQVFTQLCLLCLLLLVARCNGLHKFLKGKELATRKEEAYPLYVFGDSYVDTGNHDPNSSDADIAKPWKFPYGLTWPGEASGRYSDGHVLTDLLVSFLDAKDPILYRTLNIDEGGLPEGRGINFAFGGSGVFSTINPLVLNVSMQIRELQTLIDLGIVSSDDISRSAVLFAINGNDYINYGKEHPDFSGIESFIPAVVTQMAVDLVILYIIGFRDFFVSYLSPLGCAPYITAANNYTACNETFNNASSYHNSLLEAHIDHIQQELTDIAISTIDLYEGFTEVIEGTGGAQPLKPCCDGECGIFGENGTALYTLCSNPEEALYWDEAHPTNFVWQKMFESVLQLQSQKTFESKLPLQAT